MSVLVRRMERKGPLPETFMLSKPPEIDVETSPVFDRNWYRVQFVLEALLVLTIVAGLAGVFGNGWLSTSVVNVGSVEVTYDRFARKTVPFRITLRSREQRAEGAVQISLGRNLTEKAAIIRTIPTALSSKETADGTAYVFGVEKAQTQIVISVQPALFGIFTWKLKIEGDGEASLFQIIYP